jgi:hypothetical protein
MTSAIEDIAFPAICYDADTDPDELRAMLAEAQRQGSIALGPYVPEVLSYDLVRTVLRDSRFAMPQGMGLVVQGIDSGPVWERVTKLLISRGPMRLRRRHRPVLPRPDHLCPARRPQRGLAPVLGLGRRYQ